GPALPARVAELVGGRGPPPAVHSERAVLAEHAEPGAGMLAQAAEKIRLLSRLGEGERIGGDRHLGPRRLDPAFGQPAPEAVEVEDASAEDREREDVDRQDPVEEHPPSPPAQPNRAVLIPRRNGT